MVEIILIVAGILYLLLVIGYTHQLIESYGKGYSVSQKYILELTAALLMFFLIPFMVGMLLYDITVENL